MFRQNGETLQTSLHSQCKIQKQKSRLSTAFCVTVIGYRLRFVLFIIVRPVLGHAHQVDAVIRRLDDLEMQRR